MSREPELSAPRLEHHSTASQLRSRATESRPMIAASTADTRAVASESPTEQAATSRAHRALAPAPAAESPSNSHPRRARARAGCQTIRPASPACFRAPGEPVERDVHSPKAMKRAGEHTIPDRTQCHCTAPTSSVIRSSGAFRREIFPGITKDRAVRVFALARLMLSVG